MDIIKVKTPPKHPGVYLYKDKKGEIIYIGKAKDLSNRVKSYFNNEHKNDIKTKQLVKNIADIEYILTSNELEALILESVLIKKHKPRFNIRLRDDKNYQFIKIDYGFPIPQIYSVRKTEETSSRSKTAKYFGPYTSGLNVRNTLRLIKKIFPYCQGKQVGNRPCFNYQLHRCPGVCIGAISLEEYKTILASVELFLQGKNKTIESLLRRQMNRLARKKNFEQAARLRDQWQALRSLEEQQKIISVKNTNQDYIGFYRQASLAAIYLFIVRNGRLIGKESLIMENLDNKSDDEVLAAFLERFYLDATNIPRQILLPFKVADQDLLEKFLVKRFEQVTGKKKKITIRVPQIGTKRQLVNLACENAENFLWQQKNSFEKEKNLIIRGLEELKKLTSLSRIPQRIEGFDISNIHGKYAVGSMVVFADGRAHKDQYRKFRIKTKNTPDDYAMMKEVLTRRLKNNWPKPDLWLVDGGRGQLGVALQVLKQQKIRIPVIALAKDKNGQTGEKIFLPGKKEPIILSDDNPAKIIIQRLRDEAHRFAITYHRNVRSQGLLSDKS